MNAREKGFLLLTSHLGNPEQKVLTVPQLRVLAQCVTASQLGEKSGHVAAEDLMELGYNRPSAQRIVDLLSRENLLNRYLLQAKQHNCLPVTRVSESYPDRLRKRLGLDAPGVLWAMGDIGISHMPAIALVGSRDLNEKNLAFAKETGRQAALQGFALVSGNARGADRAAQDSCLEHGGYVISVVADALNTHTHHERILYLSEDGFDIPFSPQRALLRNRIIHSLGEKTFVAQCTLQKGGTWEGTKGNLKHSWSDVFCFDDSSAACRELVQMGAVPVSIDMLSDFSGMQSASMRFDTQ